MRIAQHTLFFIRPRLFSNRRIQLVVPSNANMDQRLAKRAPASTCPTQRSHRSLHCLPFLPGNLAPMTVQCLVPYFWTSLSIMRSSFSVHLLTGLRSLRRCAASSKSRERPAAGECGGDAAIAAASMASWRAYPQRASDRRRVAEALPFAFCPVPAQLPFPYAFDLINICFQTLSFAGNKQKIERSCTAPRPPHQLTEQ